MGKEKMNYLSVCSGIEAASCAWHDFGWNPVGFSEIEKFPSEVLNHHYPQVTNFGDMTKYKDWNINGTVGLLVGGTPCQSFSVAGLRKGLEDPRGNLALTYVGILNHFRPKWFVWENVPGVLSSGGGKDFGSFLGAVAELGYGFAYRVLNAEHFGVAQRRRRVFVVGCSSGWELAAKVLFESESLHRDTKKSKQKREEAPGYVESSFGGYRQDYLGGTVRASGGSLSGGSETFVTTKTVGTLLARDYKGLGSYDHDKMIVESNKKFACYEDSRRIGLRELGNKTNTLQAFMGTGGGNVPLVQPYNITFCDANGTRKDRPNGGLYVNETNISNTITQNGVGTNVAHAFKIRGGGGNGGKGYLGSDEKAFTISTIQDQQIAVGIDSYNLCETGNVSQTIKSPQGGVLESVGGIRLGMAVRRLTPIECERLQGFPDDYTNIKENCPDGPRYKALGNSMAVPVMRWIGKRIKALS
jgi:DNA (cytosine-5)-methyltransferase 1